MKLSAKRKQAIYSAVHERIMQLRIELAQHDKLQSGEIGLMVDHKIARAMDEAAAAAVKAAEGR